MAACVLVAVASASGLWWHRHATQNRLVGTHASTPSSDGLAKILQEENDVRRLHLMAEWVAEHETPDIVAAIKPLSGQNRFTLLWLLSAKIAELNPRENPEQIQRRMTALLETLDRDPDDPSSPHPVSLQEKMLALARTDATAALKSLAGMRIHPNEREKIICAILAQAAETDPRNALQLLEGRTDVSHADAIGAIALAWTGKDPSAALAWVLTLPASKSRDGIADNVLEKWASQDLASAVEAATGTGDIFGANHRRTVEHLLTRWLQESPEESAAWVGKQQNPPLIVVKAAIQALAKTHPLLAADLLAKRLPYTQQGRQVSGLVDGWMEKDPAGCLTWIRNQPVNTVFFTAAQSAAVNLAQKDPAAAIAFVNSLPRDAYVGDIIAGVAGSMRPSEAALNWLLSLPAESVGQDTLADAIGRIDFAQPQDALALLSRMPEGAGQNAVYAAVAAAWMSKDRKGAVAWLATLQNPATLLVALKAVDYEWSQADPQGMAAFAKQLGSGQAYDSLVPQAARFWAEKDPAAAAAWLLNLADSSASRQAASTVFPKLTLYRPDEAARLIGALPTSDGRHEIALSWAMREMAKSQPEAAARLLTTLGTPDEQTKWAHRMAYDWGGQNLVEATQWASGLPSGKVRDSALTGVVIKMAAENPEKAMAMADLASSPVQHDDIIASALFQWSHRDPAAALAALDKSALPETRKLQLKKLFTRSP